MTSMQPDSIAFRSRSVFTRGLSVQFECTDATTRSAASRMACGRSNLPSLKISTSIPCRTGHTGVVRERALACLIHKGGVKPPCNFEDRLWSVTAKNLRPFEAIACAIVFNEALPSDHEV